MRVQNMFLVGSSVKSRPLVLTVPRCALLCDSYLLAIKILPLLVNSSRQKKEDPSFFIFNAKSPVKFALLT